MCWSCEAAKGTARPPHWCVSREIANGDPEPDPNVPETCACDGKHYH